MRYNELLEKQALQESRESEERHRLQLADELSVGLGAVALAAVTGIAGPEYKEVRPLPTAERLRKLGSASVSNMIRIDRPSFMNSLKIEQTVAIDEQAVLGRAKQQEYSLVA